MPRMFSFMDIEFNSEKRFVESQGMPGYIFPPLVRKTLVVYPQVEYDSEGHYSVNWKTQSTEIVRIWIAALGNAEWIPETEKHAAHFSTQRLCKAYIKMIVWRKMSNQSANVAPVHMCDAHLNNSEGNIWWIHKNSSPSKKGIFMKLSFFVFFFLPSIRNLLIALGSGSACL